MKRCYILDGWEGQFVKRLDAMLPRDALAVDEAMGVEKDLSDKENSVSPNDTAIAGDALSTNCVLVTNNTRQCQRVSGLNQESWVNPKQ